MQATVRQQHERTVHWIGVLLSLAMLGACNNPPAERADTAGSKQDGPIIVYSAAAITQPMHAVLDSFSARTGVQYQQETAASLELARKVTELGGTPDVMVLADPEIFATLLSPKFTPWHAVFARNRIVLAYTAKSQGAGAIDSLNWFKVIARPNVEVGRADPNTDPSGYRTLLVWQLAERFYHVPGLYDAMLRAAPARNVRAREAEQVALLQAGELDYIWTYQNLAENAGLPYVRLPSAIDLGEPADSASYAFASTRVRGRKTGDTLTMRGHPILFGVSIPTTAHHAAAASRFVAFLLSPDGARILRGKHFDALDRPLFYGPAIPPALHALDSTAVRDTARRR